MPTKSLSEVNRLARRLKKYQILKQLSLIELKQLVVESEIITVDAGEILFSYDTPGDYLYYVIDGCIILFLSSDSDKYFSYARIGHMLGEMGVFSGETYGIRAQIHRTARLLKISKTDLFKHFTDPKLLSQLVQKMAKRWRNLAIGREVNQYPAKNVVLYFMTKAVSIAQVKAIFEECAADDVTRIFDKQDCIEKESDFISFIDRCEDTPGVNIFLLEPGDDILTRSWSVITEYMYIITDDEVGKIDQVILDELKGRPCDLAVLHVKPPPYHGTVDFYKKYNFFRHHHLQNEKFYFQRLYRFMTGQAFGLVFSGGGFRGYTHYGLIKALCESGIPIDAIGGASMGAVIGAGLALNPHWKSFDKTYSQAMNQFKTKRFFDFTWPISSILSGQLATNVIKDTFGNIRIEDLPTNFWCVVSNLSKRQKEIKHQGWLWEWLRATMAIPGIFPPFEKNGSIYVDGAVCTNLPIHDMREYLFGAGTIVSLDIRLPLLSQDKYSCPPVLTLKDALAYKLGLNKKKYVFPDLLDILVESSSINQHIYDTEGAKTADIIISPDTSSLSFINPSKGNPLSLIAYEFAKKILDENQEKYARWLKK